MKKLLGLMFVLLACVAATATQSPEIREVSVALTVTAGAYDIGDNIGGKLTFENLACNKGRGGFLTGIWIYDNSSQAITYDVSIFGSNPSASTFTNNAAQTVDDADLTKKKLVIQVLSTDRFDDSANGLGQLAGLKTPLISDTGGTDGANFYVVLKAVTQPTYAAASDVTVRLQYQCE